MSTMSTYTDAQIADVIDHDNLARGLRDTGAPQLARDRAIRILDAHFAATEANGTVTTWSDVRAAVAAEEAALASYQDNPCDELAIIWESAVDTVRATMRAYKMDRHAGRVGPN